jgi:type I restriction enzyme S subunit
VRPLSDLDLRWVYYALIHQRIGEIDDGSPIPSTTRSAVYARSTQVPPVAEQRAIGEVLGALDDKIEANRWMNESLEVVARNVFKSWFVDFDPVRAKMKGGNTGLVPDLSAQFADHLTVQGVPYDWKTGSLGELCTLKRGYDLPATMRETGQIPIVSSSGLSGTHSTAKVRGPGVVTGRYGTIGQVFFVNSDFWPLNTALYVSDFRGNEPRVVYYTLCSIDYSKFADKAAVPGVNRNDLHKEPVCIAPPNVQSIFAVTLKPVWDRQNANDDQIKTLGELRDFLIPRLMSGKIRVRDGDKLVGEARG